MDSINDVRTSMLQRAARLVNGTHSEEAWHLISLFQQSQPVAFLRICHHILASFLELTHDYFDDDWPLQSRLLTRASSLASLCDRLSNSRAKSNDVDPLVFATANDSTDIFSPRPSPQFCSPIIAKDRTKNGQPLTPSQQGLAKFKSLSAKCLLKQILPSKPRTLPQENCERTAEFSTIMRHNAMSVGHCSTPLGSNTWNCSPRIGSRSNKEMCDNLNSMICRFLINYMLQSPAICQTEGIFRIPGSSQRIRELWSQLREYVCSSYYRFPQPTPDTPSFSPADEWGLYIILESYSPHDLASLLLRCLSNCSLSSSKHAMQFLSDDAVNSSKSNGLIHEQAAELCFMATRLQYSFVPNDESSDFSEDWKRILCHAQQLLAYRIVLQFLLPAPERSLLLSLLQLFQKVTCSSESSRMPAECLARCAAVAVFGSPSESSTPEQLTSADRERNPLLWRIDTLTNLIRVADRLDDLPGVVYLAVKNRLRSRFGLSPIAASTQPNNQRDSPNSYEFGYTGAVAKRTYCLPGNRLPTSVEPISKSSRLDNDAKVDSTPVRPALDRTSRTRASLIRAMSSVDAGQGISTAAKRNMPMSDAFKFWRRRKPLPPSVHNLRSTGNRLTKVLSSSAIERRRFLPTRMDSLREISSNGSE